MPLESANLCFIFFIHGGTAKSWAVEDAEIGKFVPRFTEEHSSAVQLPSSEILISTRSVPLILCLTDLFGSTLRQYQNL
eukprot:scaffold4800_cov179-Ochromonas_danica.AAC.6